MCSAIVGAPGSARPRSKTFEEYSKDTDDIWDDKEEDLSGLSTEMMRMELEKEGPPIRPRAGSKGKGKGTSEVFLVVPPCTCFAVFFTRRNRCVSYYQSNGC